MKNIVIIGASGHAKVIIDIVEKQGVFRIVGLIDTFKKLGHKIYDYAVLGTEKDMPEVLKAHAVFGGIIAVGDNFTRMHLFNKISVSNSVFQFINAIHPSARIEENVSIGNGTVIMAGTVINNNVVIGKQAILNTKCIINENTKIENFSSIAPGVTLGSHVEIGCCSAISLGAKISKNLKIGNNTVVGAGSVVLESFGDNQIVYGNPAKTMRLRQTDEKYLDARQKS